MVNIFGSCVIGRRSGLDVCVVIRTYTLKILEIAPSSMATRIAAHAAIIAANTIGSIYSNLSYFKSGIALAALYKGDESRANSGQME
jgi:hypothetical protein